MLLKETLFMWAFGLFKVPLLGYLKPTVQEASDQRTVVRIKLNWRSKNHLNSMYFGVLAAGADCGGGFLAMKVIHESKQPVSLVFKSFKAEFLKRATGDVDFVCEDGEAIRNLVERAIQSKERLNLPVKVMALPAGDHAGEPYARFELELSLKQKG